MGHHDGRFIGELWLAHWEIKNISLYYTNMQHFLQFVLYGCRLRFINIEIIEASAQLTGAW